MGILVVTADGNDGAVRSTGIQPEDKVGTSFSQDLARAGTDTRTDPAQTNESGSRLAIGGYNTGNHEGAQSIRGEAFMEFRPDAGLALPLSEVDVVTASWRGTRYGYEYQENDTSTDNINLWCRPWSAPIDSTWFDMVSLSNNMFTGVDAEVYDFMRIRRGSSVRYTPSVPEPELYEAGGDLFRQNVIAALQAGEAFQLLLTLRSSLFLYERSSFSVRLAFLTTANFQTEAANKPTLTVRSIKKSALQSVGGASIQMTDGTAVFLRREIVGGTTVINLYYQRVNSTVPVLIRKLPTTPGEHANYYGIDPAFQSFGLTRDDKNNIFVVGSRGAVQSNGSAHFHRIFSVNAFRYNGNYSWTYFTPTTMGAPDHLSVNDSHRGLINNFAPVWLPGGFGTGGKLVVMHSHRDGQWGKNQLGFAVIYAGWLMGDTAPGLQHKSSYVEPYGAESSRHRPMNSSGTGLDATAGPEPERIYTASYVAAPYNSVVERAGMDSFVVQNDHNSFGLSFPTERANSAPHDSDGKVRTVWTGDSSPHYNFMTGGRLEIREIAGDALVRSIDFTTQGLIGFPSKATMQGSAAWDIIWDNTRKVFWIYYVDASNQRNIRKVSYDPTLNNLSASSQVAGPLGPSGSSIIALRLPRQRTDIRCFLIDVAMRDGSLAPIYPAITFRDVSNNLAPLAPTLPTIDAFNATSSRNIDYTFNDPNEGDYATFHEVQIRRVSTGATVVNSGKVVSPLVGGKVYRYTIAAGALLNDTQYQMRIRNYDSVDAVGEWSEWRSFATSGTGGTVDIISPPADLEPLDRSSVLVRWTYSNTDPAKTQTGYQVRVYNDATNALISDSGIVASTATERTVSGLPSDVRARIEVAVRDTTNALSGAGIRLVFPDYDNPSVPTIDAISAYGYVEVRVTNPPPVGENPVTLSNQIARRREDEPDSAYKIIGTAPVNGVFEDYTVASGVSYCYKARSVGGPSTFSVWGATQFASTVLKGTWIAKPTDPKGTIVRFPYGGVGKQHSLDRAKTAQQFVGRAFPVYDVGEARAETIQVTTTINGEDPDSAEQYRRAVEIGREADVVLYRDGRGRKMYAMPSDWSATDLDQGSYSVSFLLNRVDYDEALPGAGIA